MFCTILTCSDFLKIPKTYHGFLNVNGHTCTFVFGWRLVNASKTGSVHSVQAFWVQKKFYWFLRMQHDGYAAMIFSSPCIKICINIIDAGKLVMNRMDFLMKMNC